MNNLIETLSTKYPEQWKTFLGWSILNSYFNGVLNGNYERLTEPQIRYLLADIHAWLDSEGIYVFVDSFERDEWQYTVSTNESGFCCETIYTTRPEALTAAVEKGMEIKQQKK